MPSEEVISISKVSVTETTDTLTVGLLKDTQAERDYIIFQCLKKQPSPDDKATQTDTYCVMNDRGGVYYGGITRVELSEQMLSVTLTAEAARELEILPASRVRMHIPQRDLEDLCKGLRHVLGYGNRSQWPTFVNI